MTRPPTIGGGETETKTLAPEAIDTPAPISQSHTAKKRNLPGIIWVLSAGIVVMLVLMVVLLWQLQELRQAAHGTSTGADSAEPQPEPSRSRGLPAKPATLGKPTPPAPPAAVPRRQNGVE